MERMPCSSKILSHGLLTNCFARSKVILNTAPLLLRGGILRSHSSVAGGEAYKDDFYKFKYGRFLWNEKERTLDGDTG
jgi:hypothetical protein